MPVLPLKTKFVKQRGAGEKTRVKQHKTLNPGQLKGPVPIRDANILIRDMFSKDDILPLCTKLSPSEIHDLSLLCLSTTNLIYNSRHHTQKARGPIGPSMMVIVSHI